jgi:deoxyribonuclease-1-like protein
VIKALHIGFMFALAIAFVLQTGCDPHYSPRGSNSKPGSYHQTDFESNAAPRIVVGSFNIRMFGKSKMAKPGVVPILVDVARKFDILAIQELRDKDQAVIPEFLRYINADGSNYAASVGPRQGYNVQTTTYFEQTVFIYDANKVELIAPSYAAHDRYGIMHRPPFVGHFRCLGVPQEQAFSFALMNVHIDPDDAHVEFKALQEIIGGIYANHRGEDDFILLGDMNEEPNKYQQYQWMRSQYAALPSEWPTNTTQTKAYDNIIFDYGYTAEYLNQSGVLNLLSEYQLTLPQAKLVSDHMPVWAVFSALETPRAEVTQGDSQAVTR